MGEVVEAESTVGKTLADQGQAATGGRGSRSLPTVGVGGTDGFGHELLQELLAEAHICNCRAVDAEVWWPGQAFEADLELLLLDVAKVDEALQETEPEGPYPTPFGGVGGSVSIALFNVGTETDVVPYMRLPEVVGIFREHSGAKLLRRGVKSMLRGEYWFPRDALHRYLATTRRELAAGATAFHQLTGRERTVFTALANGWSNEEIATRLSVSLHTVKTHLGNLYRKLGVSGRAEAAILAHQYLMSRRCTEVR